MDLPTIASPAATFKEKYEAKLAEYEQRNQGSQRTPWTNERILEVINNVRKARVSMISKQARTSMDYYWLSKYDTIVIANEDFLIFKRKSPDDPTVRIIPRNEYFGTLDDIHKACGHGGRDKMLYAIKSRYYIPRKAIEIFLALCPTCEKKKALPKKGIVTKPIVSQDFNIRGQVDLMDFQSCPDADTGDSIKDSMSTYSLDAEKFIAEIKRHRQLWDVTENRKPFRNSSKEKAWTAVARVFIPDFDTMTRLEQAEVHRKLYNKWRNIRDAYVRNIRSTRVNKSGGYIFMKQLSFLDNRYKSDATGAGRADDPADSNAHTSDEHDAGDENNSSESDDPIIERRKRAAANKRKKIRIDKTNPEPVFVQDESARKKWPSIEVVDPALTGMLHYPEFENPIAMSRGSEEVGGESFDEDRSFFDSLLPAVREFDMDQKLKFRYEVLKTIKDIRSSSAGPSRPLPDQGTCKPEPSTGYYVE